MTTDVEKADAPAEVSAAVEEVDEEPHDPHLAWGVRPISETVSTTHNRVVVNVTVNVTIDNAESQQLERLFKLLGFDQRHA